VPPFSLQGTRMSKSFAVLEQFCYWPPGKFKGKEDPA
jgi:hypothetical protein